MAENDAQSIGGPFLVAAVFCEKVLEERDGVSTIVRIVDRYSIKSPPPGSNLPPSFKLGFETNLVVALKSGDFRGKASLTIRMRAPSGEYKGKESVIPVEFNGGEHGVVVHLALAVGTDESGVFWADVLLDGRLLTRTPLRVGIDSTPPSVGGQAQDVH